MDLRDDIGRHEQALERDANAEEAAVEALDPRANKILKKAGERDHQRPPEEENTINDEHLNVGEDAKVTVNYAVLKRIQ